jgi:methionyl-tRNA formyltransferase
MKIVFMGTPDFTLPILDALKAAGHEIILVVTQPDKPRGRKAELMPPPAKEWALKNGVPVFQPERIKREEAVEELKKYPCDVCVVAAFGQILSKEILEMPRLGCVNVHASLLPKYRGAAPIQWSILNGDEYTGVTTMQMGVGLDDGDILLQKVVDIDDEITGGELFDKLSYVGGDLIVETIEKLDKGEIDPIPQNEVEATHVGMIQKELGNLDFSRSSKELSNYVRGLNPWPSAFTYLNGKMIKIWKAKPLVCNECNGSVEPGTIVLPNEKTMYIKTKDGALSVLEIQMEGKKRMSIEDFLRGNHLNPGDKVSRTR